MVGSLFSITCQQHFSIVDEHVMKALSIMIHITLVIRITCDPVKGEVSRIKACHEQGTGADGLQVIVERIAASRNATDKQLVTLQHHASDSIVVAIFIGFRRECFCHNVAFADRRQHINTRHSALCYLSCEILSTFFRGERQLAIPHEGSINGFIGSGEAHVHRTVSTVIDQDLFGSEVGNRCGTRQVISVHRHDAYAMVVNMHKAINKIVTTFPIYVVYLHVTIMAQTHIHLAIRYGQSGRLYLSKVIVVGL